MDGQLLQCRSTGYKTKIYDNWLCWNSAPEQETHTKNSEKEETKERRNYSSAFWPQCPCWNGDKKITMISTWWQNEKGENKTGGRKRKPYLNSGLQLKYDKSWAERSASSFLLSRKRKYNETVHQNVRKITQCHNSELHGYLQSKFTRKMNWSLEIKNWHDSGSTCVASKWSWKKFPREDSSNKVNKEVCYMLQEHQEGDSVLVLRAASRLITQSSTIKVKFLSFIKTLKVSLKSSNYWGSNVLLKQI